MSKEEVLFEGVADEEVAAVEVAEPVAEVESEVAVEKPAKKTRKKRVLTEEQKERLREQLKVGRLTALRNRQKRAKLKKIEQEQKVNEEEAKLSAYLQKKQQKEQALSELEALRKELAQLKAAQKSKPTKVEVVSEDTKSPEEPKKVIEKPKLENHTIPKEKKEPEPKPAPAPPKPQMSRKQLLKMMKGI